MNFHHNYTDLLDYLSPEVFDILLPYLEKNEVGIRICRPRKTKLADFRPKFKKNGHRISINNDLNKYYFSITMVHEVAHLITWMKYESSVLPHGVQWQYEYKKLMNEVLLVVDWPKKLIYALNNHLTRVNASTCTDPALFKTLNELNEGEFQLKYLESLEVGTIFSFNGRVFKKGKKLRTRHKCLEMNSSRNYLINGIAQVEIVDKYIFNRSNE
jgi:hypothetical protein